MKRLGRAAVITGAVLAAALGLGGQPGTASADAVPPGTITVPVSDANLQDVFVDPVNHTAYLATSDNGVSAVDLSTDTATTIATATRGLAGFTIDPASDTIYLGSRFSNAITVISGSSNTVTATIKLPAGMLADSLAFDPGTGLLYAGTYNNGILVIDPASGSVTATIDGVSRFHLAIALDAAHHVLYAESRGASEILVIDTATGSVTTRFPVSVSGEHETLALNGTGSTLYVIGGQSIASYSTTTYLWAGDTFVGDKPIGSGAMDDTTGTLYKPVTNIGGSSSYLAQLDATTLAVTGKIPFPKPGLMAIDEATGTLVYATTGEVLLVPLQAAGPITSASAATFTTAKMGRFTVTAPGTPPPTFTEAGKLPFGVSFSASGIFGGMPSAGTGGSYHITITARNGLGAAVTQPFTLTVHQPAAITTASHATVAHGRHVIFTVRTTGFPTATVRESGTLPPGLKFTAAKNGTATISGTPASTAKGKTYLIRLTATNGVGATTQRFTLKVT
jgi:hypothetical protein